MPVLTTFYGISVKMYFNGSEHNPPHFHVEYAGQAALVDIKTLKVLEGKLPTRAIDLITEWGKIHQEKLLEIWNTQQFEKLPPLE